MKDYIIATSSTSDLPREWLDGHGVPFISYSFTVNGELRQDAVTDELIFGIAHIIHELSQGMTLQAGTVIATGTPAGVGMGFDPPQFLKKGDVVKCFIEGIGELENTVE